MKKTKTARPVIAAKLKNRGSRQVYEYRIHHVDWEEKANFTSRSAPFSFINLQYKVYPPHHFFPSHSHTMYEFYSVMKGRVVMSVGTRKQVPVGLGAGSVVIMAPHQFHTASSERPASVVNVHFIPRWTAAQKRAMNQLCGQRLRLGKDARKNLVALNKLPSGKSTEKSAKVLKTVFSGVLESLVRKA